MEYRAALLVCVGGFVGALSRHGIAVLVPAPFPWGTLVVNVVGAFGLGLVVYRTRVAGDIPGRVRLVVATGFLSSFTTYSAFAGETLALDPRFAALNVVANYALGFSAVLLAREVIRWRS